MLALDSAGCAAMANNLDQNPQLVRVKLPFSVIQLWNDLEIGQVVKLPATNDVGKYNCILKNHFLAKISQVENFLI